MTTTTDRQIDPIEQAACTILASIPVARANRASLRAWIEKILADPNYAEFASFPGVEEGAPFSEDAGDAFAPSDVEFRAMIREDLRLRDLAIAIVLSRRGALNGPIMGLGGPLVTVTTSLAAAVARYAADLHNECAIIAQQRDDALEDGHRC